MVQTPMQDQPYLIFALHNRYYGIDAYAVREIFFLPAVLEMAEAPGAVVGVINLRGTLLPVMDLSQRLGQGPHDYALSDSLIVLAHGDQQIAILVSQVFDVIRLATPAASLTEAGAAVASQNGRSPEGTAAPAVLGLTQWNDAVVTLLNVAAVVNTPQMGLQPALQGAETTPARFFPRATTAEQHKLRERAASLRQGAAEERFHEQIALAMVGMQGERFALPVEHIREFTPVRQVTPIPCCPSHIIGNMNLRGEILTLIDIRAILQLPSQAQDETAHAVVVQVDDLIAGITVDTVFDVMYVRPSTIVPIPVATHSVHEEYLRGVVTFQEEQVSLLDLSKLLKGSELIVNEMV